MFGGDMTKKHEHSNVISESVLLCFYHTEGENNKHDIKKGKN